MMVERYPNLKEEVGDSISNFEISSLLDLNLTSGQLPHVLWRWPSIARGFILACKSWRDVHRLPFLEKQYPISARVLQWASRLQTAQSEVHCVLDAVQGDFGHNWSKSWCFCTQQVTCCDLSIFLQVVKVYFIDFSKTTSNFPKLLKFNWLFLKLNQFICNQMSVLLVHCSP